MPFNGSGVFERVYDWSEDQTNGVRIIGERMDTETDGIVAGLNDVVDGTQPFIGPVRSPNGTAASPGHSFAADTDTGFYRPAANQIGAATGGVLRALLSSSAYQINVPITGTAAQTAEDDLTEGRLVKLGNEAIFKNIKVKTNAAGNTSDLAFTANAVLASENSLSFTMETDGSWRWIENVDSVDTGTAGGTEIARLDSGKLQINDVPWWAGEITVADDAVGTLDLPSGRRGCIMAVECVSTGDNEQVQNTSSGLFRIDAGDTPSIVTINAGTNVETSINTLTGMTGTLGKTTFAPTSTGGMQIENREGKSHTYRVTFI